MMDLKYTVDVRKFGKRDCPSCGHWVPRSADRCPKCGHSFAPPWQCPQWVGYIVLAFIAFLLLWAAFH